MKILESAQLIYSSFHTLKKSQESLNIVIRDLYYEIKDNNLISKNIIEFIKFIIMGFFMIITRIELSIILI